MNMKQERERLINNHQPFVELKKRLTGDDSTTPVIKIHVRSCEEEDKSIIFELYSPKKPATVRAEVTLFADGVVEITKIVNALHSQEYVRMLGRLYLDVMDLVDILENYWF